MGSFEISDFVNGPGPLILTSSRLERFGRRTRSLNVGYFPSYVLRVHVLTTHHLARNPSELQKTTHLKFSYEIATTFLGRPKNLLFPY